MNEIDLTLLKPGTFVIYSMSLKKSIKWPARNPLAKNFVGQVRSTEGNRILQQNKSFKL